MEMYYHILEELRAGKLCLLDDDKLAEELSTAKLSSNSTSEKYYLELKDRIKERIARSPDRADATALARYAPLLAEYGNRKLVQF
jgi:hypothetical protein